MKKTTKSKARHSPSGGTRQTSQAKHVLQVPLIQHKQHLLQGDRSTDGRPRSPRKKLNRGTASASRDRFLRHKAASLPSLLLLLPPLSPNLPSSLVVSYPLIRHCHPSSVVSFSFLHPHPISIRLATCLLHPVLPAVPLLATAGQTFMSPSSPTPLSSHTLLLAFR